MKKYSEVPTVAKFKPNQPPEPMKVRVKDGERTRVISVDRICFIEKRCASGEYFYIYGCESMIGNKKITYYMQYWVSLHLWKFSLIG